MVAGSAASAAGKLVSCNGNICLVYGLNTNTIANGTLATATFQIASNPSNNTIPIQVTGVVAATGAGSSIPASGASGSVSISSAVALSTVNCSNLTITTPGSSPCTVTLNSAAASGGFAVQLSSNSGSLTVPASVTVAPGQTSASFTATAAQVSSSQTAIVTAGTGAAAKTVTLSLTLSTQLTTLSCAPSSLGSNAFSTCTVSLSQAAAGPVTVAISSSVTALAVPAGVIVAAGQSTAAFAATTGTLSGAQSASVTGTLNGQQQSTTVSLTMSVVVSSLSCSPGSVSAPGSAICTVTLSAAAPLSAAASSAGASIALSSNNASVTVPAAVTVSAGQTTGAFTATVATVASNPTAQITASYNGSSQNFSLTVAAAVSLQSFSCGPAALSSDGSSTCTITVTKPPVSAMAVAISSASPSLSVPSSVTIAPAAGYVRFSATTSTLTADATVPVAVTWNGQTLTYSISLKGGAQLNGFGCAASTLAANASTTCTVSIKSSSTSAVTVALSQGGSYLTIPSQLAIAAGNISGTFTVSNPAPTPVSNAATGITGVTEVLTASVNGQSLTAQIGLVGPAQVSGLTCSPTSLNPQSSAICTVSLTTGAASAGFAVKLATENSSVSVPVSLSIPAGAASAKFTASAGSLTSDGTATLTASANGSTSTAVLTLSAALPTTLSCSPTTLSEAQTAVCTISLQYPVTGSSTITVQTSSSIVTAPATVTASGAQTGVVFQIRAGIATSQQRVTMTASAGAKTVQTSVTIKAGLTPGISGPNQQTVTAMTAMQFNVTHSDPNRLPVSLGVSNLPDGASFDAGTGSFQWTPAAGQTGTFHVTITATNSAGLSASKTVVISVVPPKAVVHGLYNAASAALAQTCSPGSLAAVAGSGFTGQGLQEAPGTHRPMQLAGAQVMLNNTPAPILSVSDSWIQFQCPALTPGTQISLVVQPANGQPSDPMQFTLSEATPGLFELDGTTQGAILIGGTNLVAMPATDAMPSRPARIGEYLSIYATGLGPLQQTAPSNTPAPLDHLIEAMDQVVVFVGNTPSSPSSAGLAPGLAGVYQVNVQLAEGVMVGDSVPVYVEVLLSDGTVIKSNTVTVAIQN